MFYDQKLAKNKMLSIINAFISHELRNPLNSLMAQNRIKEDLYKEIKETIEQLGDSLNYE